MLYKGNISISAPVITETSNWKGNVGGEINTIVPLGIMFPQATSGYTQLVNGVTLGASVQY